MDLSFSDEDGGVGYDGPDIRPPQASKHRDQAHHSHHHHQNRRHHHGSEGSRQQTSHGGGSRRDGAGGGRHGRDSRHGRDNKRDKRRGGGGESSSSRRGHSSSDLRDRISRDRGDHRQQQQHQQKQQHHHQQRQGLSRQQEEDRRAKEERMRKFMTAAEREKREKSESHQSSTASRTSTSSSSKDSSVEIRNKRKEMEKQAIMEYEDKLKRKRDRSAEGVRRKKRREGDDATVSREGTASPEEVSDSGEDEEESGEEESGEEESGEEDSDDETEEEDESGDTASEVSVGTPEHESEEEEEVVEEPEEVKPEKALKSRKSKHRDYERDSKDRSRRNSRDRDVVSKDQQQQLPRDKDNRQREQSRGKGSSSSSYRDSEKSRGDRKSEKERERSRGRDDSSGGKDSRGSRRPSRERERVDKERRDDESSSSRARRKEEKETRERERNEIEGKWGEPEEEEKTPEHKDLHSYDDRTPERSPTPRRGEGERLHKDNEEEDEEDSRLEAALRGDHKKELEDSARSEGSFGDNVESQEKMDAVEEKLEREAAAAAAAKAAVDERDKLPPYLPSIYGCRSVDEFHCLNRIAEGTFGVVYRARDKKTQDIVALKRLKMEREKEGFPITSLREINTLLISQHRNVVTVREIVVGSNMDKIFIVMDFIEHDLKSLMETMKKKKQVFIPGEVKCLLLQLLDAIAHLHDNWILHRDLKTSNLLLSHNGILKVGDFGLAREYGSPLKPYTPVVVTLWYRAPELLLGIKEYSTYIDVWSVGCIFGEFLLMEPLFRGESETDELHKIFKLLGTASEKVWTGYNQLPAVVKGAKFVEYPISNFRSKFPTQMLSDTGLDLFKKFLAYDPKKRITCEEALQHEYFNESPTAIDPSMFPTWPAKSELSASDKVAAAKKAGSSPKPPSGGGAYKKMNDEPEGLQEAQDSQDAGGVGGANAADHGFNFVQRNQTSSLPSWNLKF